MRPSRPERRLFRGAPSANCLTMFNLALVVGLCAVAAYMLLEMRREAGARADLTARSLVTILSRDVARNIELYDLSIRTVVDGMQLPEVRNAPVQTRQRSLFGRATHATNFGGIVAFDAHGDVIVSSRPGPAFNARDREYFGVHTERDDVGLFIGRPLTSRFSGIDALPLSRRISNPDGSFAGVVGGVIHLDYFRQLFAAIRIRESDTVTLFDDDGTILMRHPFVSALIGKNVATSGSFLRLKEKREGGFRGPAMVGDGIRSFTYAQVGDLPLRLSLSMPLEAIYADWQHKVITLGSVVLILCGGILSLIYLLRRELAQRVAAEARTAQINVELQALAITDPLTGLWNRRRFDEMLARDVRRAVRKALPLSLLMIDADCFKGFNDRYGHPRGDDALKLIAAAMVEAMRDRNGSFYRIGGEEFAVILLDSPLAEAEIVAGRICENVVQRAVPHEANPHGIVTVSIGGADLSALAVADPTILLETADASLYEAKRMGRNTIRMADRPTGSSKSHLSLAV